MTDELVLVIVGRIVVGGVQSLHRPQRTPGEAPHVVEGPSSCALSNSKRPVAHSAV